KSLMSCLNNIYSILRINSNLRKNANQEFFKKFCFEIILKNFSVLLLIYLIFKEPNFLFALRKKDCLLKK
ncbi:MAG: hypothetical protein ACK52O_12925, partial [Pseudanabaena sp.]